jgi:hypothetical protein
MTELRVEAQVDPGSWNASLRACHGTIFHTAEWGRYVHAEEPGANPEFHTLLDGDGSIAGQALVFRSRSSRNLAASFTGRRWLDALPAVRDNTMTSASHLIHLIETHARRAGDVSFHVGSFASPDSEPVMKPLGFSISSRYEFELDLTKGEKHLWERIDKRRRQRIGKAVKNGVEVNEFPPDEGVLHLRRLQAESWTRIAARGGPALEGRESAGEDPIAILTRSGLGRIVGGFVDGVCVSANFFTSFNGVAYYTLSGHDARALGTHAPSLVLWETARRFKGEGMRRLNLGGCGIEALEVSSPEHGVYEFKKSFGGATIECGSGEKVLRPTARRTANLLKAAMR